MATLDPSGESHIEICSDSTCGLQAIRDYSIPSRSFGELGLEATALGDPILPCCPERSPSGLAADLSARRYDFLDAVPAATL